MFNPFKSQSEKLINASKNGRFDEVIKILEKDMSLINVRDKDNNTPLLWAADEGHIEIVRYLISLGAPLNEQDGWGNTALICAARDGHMECTVALLEAGADKTMWNNGHATAADVARRFGHTGIEGVVRSFVKKEGTPQTPPQMPVLSKTVKQRDQIRKKHEKNFIEAAKTGNLEDLEKLLAQAPTLIEARDSNGSTALMWASQEGHLETVCFLIDKGAPLNETNKWNDTALNYAAREGRTAIALALVKAGALTNIKNTYDKTAMSMAQENGYTEITHILDGTSPLLKTQEQTQPVVIIPPAAAMPLPTQASETWELAGGQKIACISVYPQMNTKTMEVFNLAARERTTISEDLKTGIRTTAPAESFDDISRSAIETALAEYKNHNGKPVDEAVVFGQRRIDKTPGL